MKRDAAALVVGLFCLVCFACVCYAAGSLLALANPDLQPRMLIGFIAVVLSFGVVAMAFAIGIAILEDR